MQTELASAVSRLLQQAEELAQKGEREKAYQVSLEATQAAPDEPLTWHVRSRNAASLEEQLMCLSRVYALDPKRPDGLAELRSAVQELLKREPFLAYVYETEQLYQVRSGRDLLINIPKNRAHEIPYLKRRPNSVAPAYRWLYASILGLLLGGVGAALLAPVAVFQALRVLAQRPERADRVRAWIAFTFAIVIWLLSIPTSWLLLIRFFPS